MNQFAQNTYQLLQNYNSKYQEELAYKQMMLELLDNCDDCFLRSCRVGHFTASALLLNKDLSKVLLMHHRKLDIWVQPGGHCDGDADVLNVAIKESQEESGIIDIKPLSQEIFDLDIHLIPPSKKEEAHYHFDVRFLLHAYNDDNLVQNHESKELRWVDKDARNAPTKSRSVLRMFEKLMVLKTYPMTFVFCLRFSFRASRWGRRFSFGLLGSA